MVIKDKHQQHIRQASSLLKKINQRNTNNQLIALPKTEAIKEGKRAIGGSVLSTKIADRKTEEGSNISRNAQDEKMM